MSRRARDRFDGLNALNRRWFLRGLAVSPLVTVPLPAAASPGEDVEITLRQGGQEVATVSPIVSDRTIEDFYRYDRVDEASANTPMNLRESGVSKLFFYRRTGADTPLSLVVIHDAPRDGSGGDVRFDFQPDALPNGGGWAVEDDPGETFTRTVADWAWAPCCTDGGAYRGGFEEGVRVTIEPSFDRGIGRWELLGGDGSVATELSRTAPVTLSVGSESGSAVAEKAALIDSIRATAGEIMLDSRAKELDARAEALLAEIDQALADGGERFQYEEALDRMLTAERVTLAGASIGGEPARETARALTELLIMFAFVAVAKAALRGTGRAGSVVVAKLEDLGAQTERGIKRLAGRPVLPPSTKRTLDDVTDEVGRRVDAWLDEHGAGLVAAGEEIVEGAETINDVFDLVSESVVGALAAIKDFAVEALTVLLYGTYLTEPPAYDDEGNRTEPPGIGPAIDARMGDLEDAIDDQRLEDAGAADRDQARQDQIASFEEERQAFLEGMSFFDDITEGASIAVIVLAVIAVGLYLVSLLVAATGAGALLSAGLALGATGFATLAGKVGLAIVALTAFSVILGFGFLENRQVEHDATVDFIVNYETH